MLKEGSRHYSGLEEAILKNVEACKDLSDLTKTSLGPNGMRKMIINHLDKIFVTSDAATILKESEVNHPAAKMISMAARMQEQEYGDGTNLVITLAGELLAQAESLIKMGLHPSQIVLGYEQALKKTLELLEKMPVTELSDYKSVTEVSKFLRSCIGSKLSGYEEFFTKIISEACVKSLPPTARNFEVEFVRVAKLLGSNVFDSFVIGGLLIPRGSETSIHKVVNPKIAVYSCPFDPQESDTKGTVLIKNATELKNYTKSEEQLAENIVKTISEAGVNLVVLGGSISELMLHYLEKYRIMAVKIQSKFELKRLCKCLNAQALVRHGAPTADEIGTCDEVSVQEIGSQRCTIFKKDSDTARLTTIVLRGGTTNLLDDIERAIDDAVNCFRCAIKEPKFVAGAGATETSLYYALEEHAKKISGLDQYAIHKFGKSFEVVPRVLAENSGLKTNDILTRLFSANSGDKSYGIDILEQDIKESSALGIYDHLATKTGAIRLAADAAITILRIDQIIIAKPAGGPKPKENKNWDED